MNKLVRQPPELKVNESDSREPLAVLYEGRWRKVEAVLSRWRLHQEWWKRPVERDYFRLRLDGGLVCEVFRDVPSGLWQLQRVYD